jgi:hypothetical protein
MLIFWNNFNIFKWDNTYLHLYEIICKHVYEIGKMERFNFFFEKTQKIQKNCFSFDILESIRVFWNITTSKMFILQKIWFKINL